ncbi:hypothetical protein JCM18694_02730 [Prolixibacter denitrificans]|uniref:Uncharacterized protein n=1 Tax=Prolixibacter denitrificans TaxID=1541063 RepID=A0ABQ0ZF12_9BACT|nr:hypothetical protein JCM18694_02730 [Prolixibacter denitrificans]
MSVPGVLSFAPEEQPVIETGNRIRVTSFVNFMAWHFGIRWEEGTFGCVDKNPNSDATI